MKHQIYNQHDGDGTAVVFLPGRGGSAVHLMKEYMGFGLEAKTLIAIQPDREWYPAPNGPKNQHEAVAGLQAAATALNEYIKDIVDDLYIPLEKVSLVGFSAGAVLAIQAATVAPWRYSVVICHNGCVLEPSILVEDKHDLHIRLYHAKDDNCFSWEERYLPTKKALEDQGYRAVFIEKDRGGHTIQDEDLVDAARHLT